MYTVLQQNTQNTFSNMKMTENYAMWMILDPIKNRAISKPVIREAMLYEALLYK